MSAADLQACAAQLLLTRASRARILESVREVEREVVSAEKALIEAFNNAAGEDSKDGATAFVYGGNVFRLPEEYWERKPGDQVAVERLIGGAAC